MNIFERPEKMEKYLEERIHGDVIIDIGCGEQPHPKATELYDNRKIPGVVFYNAEEQILPLLHYDFAIARHVIEDLNNPKNLLRELQAKGKKGYIETPSPIHEITRRVDKGMPYRGHVHHRWFVWGENGTLCLLPKLSIIEHFEFDFDLKDVNQYGWNTYFFWDNVLDFEIIDIAPLLKTAPYKDYLDMVYRACEQELLRSIYWEEKLR